MAIRAIRAAFLVTVTIAALAASGTLFGAEKMEFDVDAFGERFIVALGGKLYDNLWVITDTTPPAERNPSFPQDVAMSAEETWRCVSCHGWDYKGAAGERAKFGANTAFRSLKHLVGADLELIAGKIRRAPHEYPDVAMPDFVVEMLAMFISRGQYDRDGLMNEAGKVAGDTTRGRDIFEGACMTCHQPDGRAYLIGEKGDRSSLGWVARNRPEQAVHKIRNGVPGAEMLAVGFLEPEQIRDLVAFLQTLDPDEK